MKEAKMATDLIRVGLASLRLAESVDAATEKVVRYLQEAADRDVEITCFPETYIPGLRGASFDLPPPDQAAQERALEKICCGCKKTGVGAIVGMEWVTPAGLQNRAFVISPSGETLGYQTKNQITPGGEEKNYVPEGTRRVFEMCGLTFGIAICHEGWRYPETVRFAVLKGAQVVFQPQVTGSDKPRESPESDRKWGDSFYEKAMVCRAQENSIYFISVNTAMRSQNSASSILTPKGDVIAFTPYGKEELLVADLNLSLATRHYAKRFQPSLAEALTSIFLDNELFS